MVINSYELYHPPMVNSPYEPHEPLVVVSTPYIELINYPLRLRMLGNPLFFTSATRSHGSLLMNP